LHWVNVIPENIHLPRGENWKLWNAQVLLSETIFAPLLEIPFMGGVWIFSGMTHLCRDNMSMLSTFHISHSEVDERTWEEC
jgi:hypothetical protein